jgi:hypothetical protein
VKIHREQLPVFSVLLLERKGSGSHGSSDKNLFLCDTEVHYAHCPFVLWKIPVFQIKKSWEFIQLI